MFVARHSRRAGRGRRLWSVSLALVAAYSLCQVAAHAADAIDAGGQQNRQSGTQQVGQGQDKGQNPQAKDDDKKGEDKEKEEAEKLLLGELGGLRTWLKQYGAKLNISETSEVFGNFSGGLRRGAIYEGQTDLNLEIDFRPT